MATMPVITDEMVDQFRRIGRSRSNPRKGFALVGRAPQVVPQNNTCLGQHDCRQPCYIYPDGTPLFCLGNQCVATTPQCG
jgi:hypothetical protein